MSAQSILRPSLGPIEPGIVYPLEEFQARSGLGRTAMRSARKSGLKVRYTGGRGFVKGEWFCEWLEANGKETK
ncbi:MAG: hypothetical protein IAF94_14750 [Pirellulaceae bacterium]|nr:hypothetical protein [Pirellulaceae bacterium]